MVPGIPQALQALSVVTKTTSQSGFQLFANLPSEIRSKIWEAALILTPRIIKCKRVEERNVFTGPPAPVALLNVCRESRHIAFLYGEYELVSSLPLVYFSPVVDYLSIDAGWKPLVPSTQPQPLVPKHDFATSLSAHQLQVRKMLINPSWNNKRVIPTVQFTKFPHLERILIAADEYSVGNQSKVSCDTVYDLKMYYHVTKKTNPSLNVTLPQIAVGCLGWVGKDKWKLQHENDDNRQLIHMFNTESAMKEHQQRFREEAWKFTQERFSHGQSSIVAKLQRARELSEKKQRESRGVSKPSEDTEAPSESKPNENPPLPTAPLDSAPEYETRDSQMDRNELPAYAAPVSSDSATGQQSPGAS